MMSIGRENLTDAELLAILIGSGSFKQTAVELAKTILLHSNNNLNTLGKNGIKDFMEFNGIGEAKSITIIAALELGRRRQSTTIEVKPKITCSKDAYLQLYASLQDLPHEEFYALLLNQNNRVIKKIKISAGGVAGTVVDNKILLKYAIQELATGIILAHNHPSGNLKPSQADINITKKIKEAAKLMDMNVLDHIIVGNESYTSFADEGIVF